MKIYSINVQLRDLFRKIIIANECGGDVELAYRFSDPDGIRTGKSGYSFGICQFDINNNPNAILALREIGFTTDELSQLKAQTINLVSMNNKLSDNRNMVDKWDDKQLWECLEHSLSLCEELKTEFSRIETLLHIADYHNQFYFSKGGKLYNFLQSLSGISVSPEMIRDFKLKLPWGEKAPLDVLRRYKNITKIVQP